MKLIDKVIISIGLLDIGYIIWIGFNFITSETESVAELFQSYVAFGLPFPELQFFVVNMSYLSFLVCGIFLLLRIKKFAWLNYVNMPLRLLIVVPTLYPIFIILSKSSIELGVVFSLILIGVTELARLVIVYRWQHAVT